MVSKLLDVDDLSSLQIVLNQLVIMYFKIFHSWAPCRPLNEKRQRARARAVGKGRLLLGRGRGKGKGKGGRRTW